MKKINKEASVFKTEEGKQAVRNQYEKELENWPVPYKNRYIGETHIIECGNENAEPLFLLHGTMSNALAWMGDIEMLSRDFRVIAADLPGEPGFSNEFRVSPSSDSFELWLENLIDLCGYKTVPVSVVGQSLGSFVALKLAVKNPEKIKKISMLTTSGVAPARASFLFKAMPLMFLGKWGADRLNRMIAYKAEIGKSAEDFGMLTSRHCRSLLEPIPVFSDSELDRLKMPVQYFGGDKDVLLNTEETAGRLNALAPLAEINILKETGHVVTGQTEKVLEFLKKQG